MSAILVNTAQIITTSSFTSMCDDSVGIYFILFLGLQQNSFFHLLC
jgi:hypothetical protein